MIHLDQALIVEGKYDKIKLSSLTDALIITTNGFSIFKDKEKLALIKTLAEKNGVVILTDSDTAGFKIRNYIRGCTQKGKITNIYIPEIFGKEKRKAIPSKEGKLGVEGIPADILRDTLIKSGVAVSENSEEQSQRAEWATKIMLYDDGFIGKDNSEEKRRRLLKALSLPSILSANSLIEVLNTMFSEEEYKSAVEQININKKGM